MDEELSSSNELWQQLYDQEEPIHTSTGKVVTSTTWATSAAASHQHECRAKAKAKVISNSNSKPCSSSSSSSIRRRSRASKRTPTTLLNADAKNFRSLVQQFTGCRRRSRNYSTSISFGNHPISSAHPLNINFALGAGPPPPLQPNFAENYSTITVTSTSTSTSTTPHYLSQLLVQQRAAANRDEEHKKQYYLPQGQGQQLSSSTIDHDHHQEQLSSVDGTTNSSITTNNLHHDHDHDQDFGVMASAAAACFPRSCPDQDIPQGLVVDDIMYFLAGIV